MPDLRQSVQAELDRFVASKHAEYDALGADAVRLLDAAAEALRGGKRLRAAFCWWGHLAVSEPTDPAALVRASSALEVLHASALVHDDVMDASDTRRGRPSAHRAFEALHRGAGWPGVPENAASYGEAAAILLGDLLLSWSDELLRVSGMPADRIVEALGYLDVTRTEVTLGQFLDVSVQARGHSSIDEAMQVVRFKSAKYSVERPLHIGAALAGASPEVIAALSSYGLPLGEAFQLRDDILGVFGDVDVTGKPAGDDLVEGKRTLLIALALQTAPHDDAIRLDTALGTPLSPSDVDELRAIIDKSGARAEVETRIAKLADESTQALSAAPVREEARDALARLLVEATQRDF